MHIHDLFGWRGPMTNRQYRTWCSWKEKEWDRPDRHDWYLMQLAALLEALGGKDAVRVESKKLKFGTGTRVEPGPQMMEWSKAVWFAAAGVKHGGRSRTPEDDHQADG